MNAARMVVLVSLLAAALAGCAVADKTAALQRPEGSLAVAGFTNPTHSWELLAGYLPQENAPAPKAVLASLDEMVLAILTAHGVRNATLPSATQQCQQGVPQGEEGQSRTSAWKYWLAVGRCINADVLLVPQLIYWRERQGREMGAEAPASVILDLFLIDVKNQSVLARFHHDETQEALVDNLLKAKKFFDRKAKWVTAGELAREGLEEGLKNLGL
jgi:hypothetical protein